MEKYLKIIVLYGALWGMLSCGKEEDTPVDRSLCFNVSLEGLLTRGTPVTSLESTGSFSLYGYLYDLWNGNCTPNYIVGEKVSYEGGEWSLGHACNLNGGGHRAKYYAIAPFGADGLDVKEDEGGALNFSYEVPDDVADQSDILVSESSEYSGTETNLFLPFSHCLSSVTFKTGDKTVDGTVRRISLKGIYSQGNYEIGQGWSCLGSVRDYTINPYGEIHKNQEGEILSGGETTMMMIPQTVPSGGIVEVEIESDGETNTLSKSISGDVWEEGTSYVYCFNFGSLVKKDNSVVFAGNPYYSGDNYRMVVPDSYSDWNYRICWDGVEKELPFLSDLSDCSVTLDINSKSSNKGSYSLNYSGNHLFNAASFQGGKLTHHGLKVSGKLVLPDEAEDYGMMQDIPINFYLMNEDGTKIYDSWQYTLKGYMYTDINFKGSLDGCNTSNSLLVTAGTVSVTYMNSDYDSFERNYTGEEFKNSFEIVLENSNGAGSYVSEYYTGYEIFFTATKWSSKTTVYLRSLTNGKEICLGTVYPYQ